MEKYYIELGGTNYRVEFNWLSISEFLKAIGKDTLTGIDELANIKASQIHELLRAAIVEGESIEGRTFKLSAKDVGRMMRISQTAKVFEIYAKQVGSMMEPEVGKESAIEEKKN